jgi:hypothetical protein
MKNENLMYIKIEVREIYNITKYKGRTWIEKEKKYSAHSISSNEIR